jgi:predicted SnoaL-like aldol condensation-catalyzing enzyme
MVIHLCDHTVRPVVDLLSRRTILHGLGGASVIAAAAATLSPQLVQAQNTTPTADLEANKVLARRYHDEIFEQGNLDVADEILTPDFTWYAPPQTVFVVGPAAVKQTAQDVRAYFAGLALSADDVIAEGDRVVIRWTLTGTVQTDHGAVPVVYTGIDIFRIADGKLAELWQNTDDYGLAQQLGEIPVEGTPAASTPTT